MLNLSQSQIGSLEAAQQSRLCRRLAGELRRDARTAVVQLGDAELEAFVAAARGEAVGLGLTSDADISVFIAPCIVYGAYAHLDPLFEPIFYAALPGQGARRRLGPPAIAAATRTVVAAELGHRSVPQFTADLARMLLASAQAGPRPQTLIEVHFRPRFARLAAGLLQAHQALAAAEADLLGLQHADARRLHADAAQLFGACFARDPRYPWAVAALAGSGDDRQRIGRLLVALQAVAAQSAPAT